MHSKTWSLIPLAFIAALLFSNPAEAQFWKRNKDKGDSEEGETKERSKKKDGDHRCEDIPLEWNPDEEYSDLDSVNLTGISSLPIEVGTFADKRRIEDPREIGRNIEDEDDDDEEDRKTLYVTTDSDIRAFVQRYSEEVLSELGYNVVGPGEGKIKISGDIREFHVEEDNTYGAEVRLLIRVADAGGAVIYEAMHGEGESAWGRSYKCETYMEVLSDALMETVHDMAENDKFYDALKKVAR